MHGVRRRVARRRGREARRHPRHAAARGHPREGEGPPQAQVGRRLAAEDGVEGRVPGGRPRRSRRRPHEAPGPAVLAGRPGAVHHAPGRDHQGPEDGYPERRDVPHAGHRSHLDLHALADAQGRPRRPARCRGRADPGRGRDRARSGDGLLGERAAAEAPRRAHARRLPAGRARGARRVQDGSTRGTGERRDRPRGLGREGRRRDRGAVRRPHGVLLARGAVPDLPDLGDDHASRRDLCVDRRRQAPGGGRLARQGDRAHLPSRPCA